MADLNLPILDLSQLDAGPEAAARFRDDLRAATHDVGFFYLTGTGVSPELEARLHRAARDFFALPEADKLAIENVKSPHFRGYTRIGGERTQGKVDWREQIDIGPEREAITDPEAPDFARLIGPNLWPDAQPELRDVVSEWHDHLSGVARKLLRAWALALGAPENYFDEHFGEPSTLIKIVRYPGKEDPTPQQGVGAHKDSGVLTLLWVEPGKGGLQVERDGEWVDAPPVPGAFVVNIGELLEYATERLPHRDEAPRDLAALPGRPHLGAVLLQPGARQAAAADRAAGRARRRGARRHAGPGEPDPRALRRERAQVAPARAPRRRRDPPRRPRRGAGRGIRLTSRTPESATQGPQSRRPCVSRRASGTTTKAAPHLGRPSEEVRLNAGCD